MRNFFASFLVAALALVSCSSTEYIVKDEGKGQINPKTTLCLNSVMLSRRSGRKTSR